MKEAVKCCSISYDSDIFRYNFLDDKYRKVLRHCYVMYKDKEKKGHY